MLAFYAGFIAFTLSRRTLPAHARPGFMKTFGAVSLIGAACAVAAAGISLGFSLGLHLPFLLGYGSVLAIMGAAFLIATTNKKVE